MTRRVKIGEAKTHLSALLADVEAGEDLVICRGPTPIAHVTRVAGEDEPDAAMTPTRPGGTTFANASGVPAM